MSEDAKTAALLGAMALALLLLLRSERGAGGGIGGGGEPGGGGGSIPDLKECRIFLKEDGTLRVNGADATLSDIERGCARRVFLSSSGAARYGDLEKLRADLSARGFEIVEAE